MVWFLFLFVGKVVHFTIEAGDNVQYLTGRGSGVVIIFNGDSMGGGGKRIKTALFYKMLLEYSFYNASVLLPSTEEDRIFQFRNTSNPASRAPLPLHLFAQTTNLISDAACVKLTECAQVATHSCTASPATTSLQILLCCHQAKLNRWQPRHLPLGESEITEVYCISFIMSCLLTRCFIGTLLRSVTILVCKLYVFSLICSRYDIKINEMVFFTHQMELSQQFASHQSQQGWKTFCNAH